MLPRAPGVESADGAVEMTDEAAPEELPVDPRVASEPGSPPPAEPIPSADIPEAVVPGGFWRRAGALFLDGVILYVGLIPATILLWLDPLGIAWVALTWVVSIGGFIFYIVCWARWGATPGKRLMGLRIVRSTDLGKISGWRAAGRYFAYLLATLPLGLGLLWVVFNKERRGWHDMLAGTRVLRVPTLRERGATRERRLTLGAIALGSVTLVAFFALTIVVAFNQVFGGIRDASGAITSRQSIFVFAMRVGDCFDIPASGLVSTVIATPCGDAHHYEIYATPSLSATSYPSEDEMLQLANAECVTRFEGYVGETLGSSNLDATYIAPDKTAWKGGTHKLLCIAYDSTGGKLNGSLKAP